jgi:hypothetical protein
MYLPLRKLPTILLLDGPFLTEWDKNEHRDFSSDMSKRGSVLAGAITKGVVLMEKIAGSFTNAATLFKFFEVIGDLGPE